MQLSEDHRAVQDAVRAYVQDRIAPQAAQWDRDHHFPAEELRGLAALGCYGVAVPTQWDGAGLDYLALAVILEEVAAGCGATSTIVSVNNCPVCSILLAWGNDAQKAQWLKPLARGDMLGAFCLTEPHVGSQADGLRTVAVKDGDSYVLNGVKQFVTSGKNANVAIVMAVTDKAAGKKGISAFHGAHHNAGLPASPASKTRWASTPATRRRCNVRELPRAGGQPASAKRARA